MALISTYDLRLWLGIEAGDKAPNAKLSSIAQAVEDFVDSFTNRKLEAKVYRTDPYFCYLDGNGRSYMYLPQYPISYVSEVNVDSNRTFGSSTIIPSSNYFYEPNGKVFFDSIALFGGFQSGRRNIRVDFIAGYAPVGQTGTYNSAVSTYPIPQDLKQTMTEMCVESFKEGMTAVHSIQGANVSEPKFIQMLTRNSFWSNVLNKYKAFDAAFAGREE